MRRHYVFPVLLATFAAGLYACTTDDTPGGGGPGIDGGTPGSEAGPIPTGGEAGADTGAVTDATVADSTVDAPVPPAPVTVVVANDRRVPVAGADVYFVSSTGTVTKVTTGADGRAVGVGVVDGAVFVGTESNVFQNPQRHLTTVTGVVPGDVIQVLVEPPGNPFTLPQITGTAKTPPNTYLTLDHGQCAQGDIGGENFGITPSAACLDENGKFTLAITAVDTQTDTPKSRAIKQVSVAPDGGAVVANVALADFVNVTPKDVTYTGQFPAWSDNSWRSAFFPVGAQQFALAEGFEVPSDPLTLYPLPASVSPNVVLHVSASDFKGNQRSQSARYRRVPAAGALAENYGTLLPRVHDPVLSGTNVTWQADAPLGVDATASLTLDGNVKGDASQAFVSWQVLFPAQSTTTSFTLPAIPPALAAYVANGPGWNFKNITLAASPQAPYALAHRVPSVLRRPEAHFHRLPAAGDLELRVTSVTTELAR
jgi:hypothetical protein